MFTNRTLVVVGAGASSECKLPTGQQLKSEIASLLNLRFEDGYNLSSGDHEICDALRLQAQRENQRNGLNAYIHKAWHIRQAMPQAISIDNFLDSHQGDVALELCGKLAIVRAVLNGEKASLLYVNPRGQDQHPNYSALEGTWYTEFMKLLTENCRLSQLRERLSGITFVVFNYDRCVEYFLFHGIQNYYNVSESDAADVLGSLNVYHPYGTVGALPWAKGSHHVGFGATPTGSQLLALAGGIKTFSEGTDPSSSDIQAIRQSVSEANIILFLGFAFHKLNLALLKPDTPHSDATRVRYLGTAKGMSHSDCEIVRDELVSLASGQPGRITLRNDLLCGQVFQEYWRSLSLS